MKQGARLMPLIWIISIAFLVAGCTGTSPPVSVDGLRQTVGSSLPGAQGKTRADQVKIDRTVARLCAADVYGPKLCDAHTVASRARFAGR